jgi:aspartyl/glutamyl-tRNA(Asn/Gln) amidotransferase C subunit
MKLSKEEIKQLVHLCSMHLTDQEVERFTDDLPPVFAYARKVLEIPGSGTRFNQNRYESTASLRADVAQNSSGSENRERYLNLTDNSEGYYRSKRILTSSNT